MSFMLMGKNMIAATADATGGQQYTLTVLNENSKFQQFALYQTIPDIIGPSTNPVSLAWMLGSAASGSPDNPSQSQFLWYINYAATTGYIQDQGTTTNPRQFSTASSIGVLIDSDNSVGVTYQGLFPNGAPAFPAAPTTGKSGLIQVQADNLIPTAPQQASYKMTVNVGIAMSNKPAIAVQLEPNLLYQFTPKPTYYILAGSFVQGQVIDTSTSSAAFEVKFQGVTNRTVVFTDKNQFQDA